VLDVGIDDERQIGRVGEPALAPGREARVQLPVSALTSLAEILVPQSCSTIALTFRVETPWKYISIMARTNACSLRSYLAKSDGRKSPARSRGTLSVRAPTRVLNARG